MRTITLASTDATDTHTGHLPESWAEVGLAHYVALASAQTLPETCRALAALCGLPAEVLTSDASLAVPIRKAAPWLFEKDSLPEPATVPSFTHAGIPYEHVGNLHKINAGQMEALLDFLEDNEADSLKASPHLLAVLYKPVGVDEQTSEVVDAAAAAFETLPMSVAWPALTSFTRAGQGSAASTRMYLAVAPKAEALLTTLEQSLASTGASKSFFRKPLNWGIRRWIKYVRSTLPMS